MKDWKVKPWPARCTSNEKRPRKLQTNNSLYFIRTLKNYLNIRKKEISSEDALNAIIYGINCMKIKQGKAKNIQIFQIDTRPQIISLADKIEEKVEEIDITNIIAVSFDINNENINSFKVNTPLIPIEPHSYIQILINKMIYDFIFENENDLCLFIAGIIHLYENMIDFGFTNMENNIKKELRVIVYIKYMRIIISCFI